jgi:glycosidase
MYDATKTNWQAYWGDDLVGIQEKLPYLQAMGVTAL